MSRFFKPINTLKLTWYNELPYTKENNLYCLPWEVQLGREHAYLSNNNLVQRWQQLNCRENNYFTLADTSFQAGLTFLLSWQHWLDFAPANASLYYLCSEAEPLEKADLAKILSHFPQFRAQTTLLLAAYPILTPGFHYLSFEQGRINLILMIGEINTCFQKLIICGAKDLEPMLRQYAIDAWFLKQINLKSSEDRSEFFNSVALLSKLKATLACINTGRDIKTNLEEVGFSLKISEGEVLSACYNQAQKHAKVKQTPWYMPRIKRKANNRVIVVGGGLAGCTLAHFLANKGQEVFLLDKQPDLGSEASGNTQAILYPQLSAYHSLIASFMLTTYLYAHNFYKNILINHSIGELQGILQLGYNDKEQEALNKINTHVLAYYPELGRLMDEKDTSRYAGINIPYTSLLLPLSGWLNSKALCQVLTENTHIHPINNCAVNSLFYEKNAWHCEDFSAETVVIANGYQARQFRETSFLPLKPTYGQVTLLQTNPELATLALPICGLGHILPRHNARHAVGATYHPNKLCVEDRQAENELNLNKLNSLLPNLKIPTVVVADWQGIRATTPDYFPLVGPLPNEEVFKQYFAPLGKDPKRWLPVWGGYYPGLYIFTGFGSRGLTSIPLCAAWLSALITNKPAIMPSSFIRALAPARFLLKAMLN
ncbi:FAD-dependent 5-carboxymethylaminomethyl-2-thiouridine(34) oxidoreductase MnmC [Legionella sp. D16C41]|uniref:FAD-dependent 5-carboxymethylaminomethyl-2-thiouridine(34) oxidoreductase MnmC n=1 Tax=Legionella sp. D16C41 TaxID=3402688 RepID=UPI003AF42E59